MKRKFTNIQEKEICEQYNKNKLGTIVLSKKWGCNPSTVGNVLERQGYHLRNLSESHKGKHSLKKGIKLSKEHKKKISNSCKGKCHSEETKRRIGKASKGRYHSKKSKEKMSKAHKGRKFSEEHKQKLSESHKNQKLSKETRRKISKNNKRAFLSKSALIRIQNNPGPFTNTKPELKMKEILNSLGIPFEHQFRLGNHLYDFHILNTNILIEVDGDYFHSNPEKFKRLNKMQLYQRQRDIRNKKLAKENNFILLRFWQNDILNNAEEVRNKILKNII
ncbi:MAG: DUF559 domain-containing protein [Candidatus Cloacimonetes bacterium]|nr:DUF559 domain-containing protein [Candidatus Cloacimonadota bacterium]